MVFILEIIKLIGFERLIPLILRFLNLSQILSDMSRQDFHYSLPDSLIARQPAADRTGSRLLYLDGGDGHLKDQQFADLLEYVQPGDLMVMNDTQVIPARMFAQKETGGKIEILVERLKDSHNLLAHVRSSKSPKPGGVLVLEDGTRIEVMGREGALFDLRFPQEAPIIETLDAIGHMPLPPYIDRADTLDDRERYQTVYGKNKGAVAAPTAGLHFDEPFIAKLKEKGVDIVFVTLHVGAGTFQPVRVDDIETHDMHSEYMVLSDEVAQKVRNTKAKGHRVIAIGTTSVRTLESAAQVTVSEDDGGSLERFSAHQGDTNIFIYPGYEFKIVDALVTNFHLPESTLIMLISAFAGYKNTMAAYEHAVKEKYRFFSYGDAMFIIKNPEAKNEMVTT